MSAIFLHSERPPAAQVSGWAVDETLGDEAAEAEAGERALAAGDRDRRAGLDLAIAAVVLRRDRLLEPADVEVLDGARVAQRVDGVVGVVGIDHQPDLRADLVAQRACQADVLADAPADLELHRREASGRMRGC